VEPEEAFIAREWLGKHVPAAKNTETAMDVMLGAMVIKES
jgi:hypothetical protein